MLNQSNNYVVVGLGKSGVSIIRYLLRQGKTVIAMDTRKEPPGVESFVKEFPQVTLYLGSLNEMILAQASEIILSPGVAPQEPALVKANSLGIPLIGDIELFARAAKAPIVAITGTNAKGTVTTLMGEMIHNANHNVLVGGNIGTPALDLLEEDVPDFYVLELSSFQLETTYSLKTAAATILNFSEDHLDRHKTMSAYSAAKQRIYQDCKVAVWNREDEKTFPITQHSEHPHPQPLSHKKTLWERGEESSPLPERSEGRGVGGEGAEDLHKLFSFALTEPQTNEFGILEHDNQTWLACGSEKLLPVEKLLIKGRHNWKNALAALALGTAIGLPLQPMLQALMNFRGLAHRCEWVAEKDGVVWYDDSKGTNVGATLAAIEGLGQSIAGKIILIAGGLGKGADFSPLREPIAQHVKAVILIGKDAPIIERALNGATKIIHAVDLAQAVTLAKTEAHVKDAVLLSPACASMDMFRDYEHRGEVFKELVKSICK